MLISVGNFMRRHIWDIYTIQKRRSARSPCSPLISPAVRHILCITLCFFSLSLSLSLLFCDCDSICQFSSIFCSRCDILSISAPMIVACAAFVASTYHHPLPRYPLFIFSWLFSAASPCCECRTMIRF